MNKVCTSLVTKFKSGLLAAMVHYPTEMGPTNYTTSWTLLVLASDCRPQFSDNRNESMGMDPSLGLEKFPYLEQWGGSGGGRSRGRWRPWMRREGRVRVPTRTVGRGKAVRTWRLVERCSEGAGRERGKGGGGERSARIIN
ncbi:hypothetical protein E2542_SST10544 [Spatholobus suberectus]|nr:hypothetical protein E2542_SST10544 [Spatholobus suberectus]